jgi:hypothetical protein
LWTVGYGLLVILIAACGFLLWRSPSRIDFRHRGIPASGRAVLDAMAALVFSPPCRRACSSR